MPDSAKIDEQQVVRQAQEAGALYFKEHFDLDVEFTDYQMLPKEFGSITVKGHVKGKPEEKVDAIVEITKQFSISSASIPSKYLDD